MPIKYNGFFIDNIFHGGLIPLESLCEQVLEVTIKFPFEGTSNKPLTVNLGREIGISSESRPYAVKWGDESTDKDTISNDMNAYKHEHTYQIADGSVHSKTYRVTIYGDHLLPFYGNTFSSGDGDMNFTVESREVSLIERNI